MAISTYDVYMVDTPKEDDDGEVKKDPVEDKPADAPPKRRRPRRRPKLRRTKDSNTGTEDNDTSENAEDHEAPAKPTSDQDDQEEGQVNRDDAVEIEDSEDSNYLPISEDEVSLGNEDFIMPEEPFEQERFKRQLTATARSLKKSSNDFKLNRIRSTIDG